MDPDLQSQSLDKQLYIETPTVFSPPLSKISGFDVYLKLENLQVPGSFKIRGIGNQCQKARRNGFKRIVCASTGNGGLAAAYAAKQLGLHATIILPIKTSQVVSDKLRTLFSAEVIYYGNFIDESNTHAAKMSEDAECALIYSSDHPDAWDAISTIISEVALQLEPIPDLVVACCGVGGFMNGLLEGMQREGWSDVPLLVMETIGADSLNASVKAKKLVTLPDIVSVAKSLGACTVSATALENCFKYKVISSVVRDSEAVSACLKFADDHRMLVEPACGATLSAIYSEVIQKIQNEGEIGPVKTVLLIVCGGSLVTLSELQKLKEQYSL